MTNNELNFSANYIQKLATQPNANERISLYLSSLFECYAQQKDNFRVQKNQRSAVSSVMKFTYEETIKMATTFKKQFIANGLVAHVIKRKSGKNSFCYEIRYRSNGFEFSAAANDLNEAKANFYKKTFRRKSKNTAPKAQSTLKIIFAAFSKNGISIKKVRF